MMIKRNIFYISFIYFFSAFSHGQVITLAINDWCPYICDPAAEKPGILIEIVQDVFETEGYQVRFSKMPLNRSIVEIQNNRIQGIIGIVPEVLPELIFPEEPIISTQFCFFTLPKSEWEYNPLTGYYPNTRVAIVAGKKTDTHIDKAFPNIEKIHGVQNTSKRLIEMLRFQRIDTFIEDKTVTLYSLKQHSPTLPLRIAGCAEKKQEYVAFSPTDPHSNKYATILSKGIKRLRKSDQIKKITASYIE